ncbi:RNA polymerase sigma factor [Paenibacillus pasadenensis]|uniref:RNA polymerase sigma-70 factor n=1 Tax=Paenibacillus pasadenensis TaxID=217090 RepID=A0A2N5N990_9BACL|nr:MULTISPECIES: sigma-70 family RNA polymerase sigma factor [Paenibacillus]PLT46850.1 RNA polymerase sigma-70 factor [Paenibacillus pasadenensis]QGG57207.1 sigma-70 family RNA polymerase sigma factor [Paenibacillus sp. B01]
MTEADWEEHLMLQIASRSSDALEKLYDRYEKPLYSFVYRIVKDSMAAEEIVQELFLKLWNHAEAYVSNGRSGKVSTWIFTMARNGAIDWLRKRDRRPAAGGQDGMDELRDPVTTELTVENRMLAEQMRQALSGLSQEQQQVIEWVYFGGYTQQEIADRHDIPLGTVKSRIRLGLRQLRSQLGESWRGEVRS